ncbi:putative stage 0 sporulation protein J [Clostridiales bacterium KA00134]|nr:putative stage 0 sporulation protein J [Clostridiales bacterium KA00134]
MTSKKRGLGRGIQNFIKDKEKVEELIGDDKDPKSLVEVNIDSIYPNPNQARKVFSQIELENLRDSILQYGLLSPLLVKKEDDKYIIIAGERRYRASKLAGLKKLPVIVKDLAQEDADKISLIENIQRVDLSPLEEAKGYDDILTSYDISIQELAETIGKSRPYISNALRLLKLDERVQEFLKEGLISKGHAILLLSVEDKDQQYKNALRIIKSGSSVKETLILIDDTKEDKDKNNLKTKKDRDIFLEDILEKLSDKLGTKVYLEKGKKSQTLKIECYGDEDFSRISEMILGGEDY